ncbi:MAG: DUF3341 domain-containing protein [Chlorobi bacterium]|nr:DUF3341 domain-containing protein [Chlorobiota bacterium]
MKNIQAIIASFETPGTLLHAAEKVRDEGYTRFDCHSSFPIHGLDDAMGLKRSPLGFIVGAMAVLGAVVGMGLQGWVTTVDYPLVFSGKPLWSWQAYIIITFAMFVLFGAFGAVFGMLFLNRIPRWHHPVFSSDRFSRVTDDGFFISIEADDPRFDPEQTAAFLASIGGKDIERIEEDAR